MPANTSGESTGIWYPTRKSKIAGVRKVLYTVESTVAITT